MKLTHDQLTNFIQQATTTIGGILAAHGATAAAVNTWQVALGAILAGLSFFWSHSTNAGVTVPPAQLAAVTPVVAPPEAPLPPPAATNAAPKASAIVPLILFCAVCSLGLLAACAKLQPGADPLVVRTEQMEAEAYNSFDTFLRLDDIANINPVVSNAWQPAHVFAQYLRKPIQSGTNTVPFGIATVLSLDNVKLAYVAGTSSSNSLVTAIGVVQAIVSQVGQYQSLTNK